MLAKFRSAVSKLRVRQREAARRRPSLNRPLSAEPLEGRLLMTGDSWVVDTDIPLQAAGSHFIPVAADNEGNVYVGTGASRIDGSTISNDIFLTKYTSAGNFGWGHDIRFPGSQAIIDVAVGDGGVYIVGVFEETVNLDPDESAAGVLQSQGGLDGFLAKYDADGEFQWAQRWGGTGDDYLEGIALSDTCVYVTGRRTISVKGFNQEMEQWVTSVSSLGVPRWEETAGPIGGNNSIAVFKPLSGPTNVYLSGTRESGGYVQRLTETVDGNDVVPVWSYDLGANTTIGGWGGISVGDVNPPVGDEDPLPSLYVLKSISGGDQALLKIRDEGDSGKYVWSAPIGITALPWGMAFDSTTETVYVAGSFGAQADFGGGLLTTRGSSDGFLARYNTDGELLASQRMGGRDYDRCYSVAATNGRVYVGSRLSSTDGDFPAGEPGKLSAFVPSDSPSELYLMQLDTAAPIVKAVYMDVSAVPDQPFTLSAQTAVGNKIVWYENGNPLPGQPDGVYPNGDYSNYTLSRPAGVYQFTAVATDATGKIGMVGVVVNVAVPTKFYVVDDNSANKTFEYDANGSPVESYSLNTANTAPRGAASTATGDKTWVVDANRKVYVYNNSGALLGSWTAGTLSTKAKVEGITTNGTDVWIVDAYSDKVYKYAGAAAYLSGTWTATSFSLNSNNRSAKDLVTDGTSIWVVDDSTMDKVFKYSLSGTYLGSWTMSGIGGSPTGITLDPFTPASQDLWIVDSTTDKVYQYTNGRNATSGTTQTATMTFALAAGNTNPQGIADPPAPSSLVTTETTVLTEPVSAEPALVGNDTALEGMYYEPLKKVRIDTVQRSTSRVVEPRTRDFSYTVGAAPNYLTGDHRWATDNDSQSDVDDLFAEWDCDPLALVSLPDLGM